jgi:hypothetical protein
VERPHAELAHVADCHRFDRLVEAGHPPYLGRRTLDTAPWPPNLAWHCARSALRFCPDEAVGFAVRRLAGTSARLAAGMTSTTATANRDARMLPRLRAMSTLSIFKRISENPAFYQRRRAPARHRPGARAPWVPQRTGADGMRPSSTASMSAARSSHLSTKSTQSFWLLGPSALSA